MLLLSAALSGETTQAVTLPSLWIYGPSTSPGVNLPSLSAFDYWQTLGPDLWRGVHKFSAAFGEGCYFTLNTGDFGGKLTSPSGCTRWGRPG